MTDKVQIKDSAEPDAQPTLQEQYDKQKAAGLHKEEEQQKPEEKTEERPPWLPEKFKTIEDMANAYAELEKKQAKPEDKKSEEKSEEKKGEEAQASIVEDASREFFENGGLTDDTYDKLAKVGLSRQVVDDYIRLQQQQGEALIRQAEDVAGGADAYKDMAKWAYNNLSKAEIDAYNKAMETQDSGQITLAVEGLKAKYVAAGNNAPNLIQGKAKGTASAAPFQSAAEVRRAMSDPRYKDDPAYRKEVENRLAFSDVL